MSRWQYRLPPPILKWWEGPSSSSSSSKWFLFFFLLTTLTCARAAVPRFFESNRMAILLLPEDTETDTIVYRLRAEDSDRNYPLLFQVKGAIGINLIYIEAHECTPSNQIYCEADVYLRRNIERGRVYIFNLTVSDQRGDYTEVVARIDGTRGQATAASRIFLKYPPSVTVREDVPPKAIIASMIARKGPKSTFGEFQVLGTARKFFKVSAANLVSRDTINGTVSVESELDYEIANLHTFKICLLQPYTDETVDTRNIACILFSVVIQDVQDEAPVFTHAPPVTRVPSTAIQGDIITKLSAIDADRGLPRNLRYSILPSSSLYTNFFRINSLTGELSMNDSAIHLRERMVSLDPILMTVTAEEVTNTPEQYPALSSSVEIAFVVLDAELLIPKFVHEKYVGEIYEDSVPDSQVYFDSPFLVQGVKGLFALELDGDNGAFSVQPGVVKDASEIKIKVKNSFLLDFEETPQIVFKLTARQVSGLQQLSGSTEITVRLIDTNDNVPKFSKPQYEVEIFENITRGTTIVRVFASDKDSGPFGAVRYTRLRGPLSDRLYLEETTGVITCSTDNHGFDREASPEYVLTVEAKDNNGQGPKFNTVTAKIILRLKDVNDSPPRFVESIYKGVMDTDRRRLRDPIRIKAIDEDAERPNNEVVYGIERSSFSDYFQIDRTTGYLDVRQNFSPRFAALNGKNPEFARQERAIVDNETVISLTVRASDLGDPQLSETVDVKIFKQEYGERVIRFIYPRPIFEVRQSMGEIENVLNTLTGGMTHITDVRPISSGFLGIDIDPTRSEVIALVRFGQNAVVDLEQIVSRLNNTEVQQLRTEKLEKEQVIKTMEDQNYSYLVGVVMLCLILCIIIIIIILCCVCEGCPLHKDRKKYNMVSDEGSEGVSYIRMDENGRYRRNADDDPTWFDSMPRFAKDLLVSCGYVPPDRNKSRMAWSADERQRHWQMNNQHGVDPGLVENRPRPNPHQSDPVMVEDLDDGRIQRSNYVDPRYKDPMARVESRLSQRSQEPRRVFVLRDPRGVPRNGETLREGETYLVEASEEAQRAKHDDTKLMNAEEENQYSRPGNAEVLRLHASSHDAAYTNKQRRGRRADVVAEGGQRYEDPGGGISSRLIEGQSVGATPREYFADDKRYDPRYDNESPPQTDVYIQTDDRDPYKMNVIHEETKSLLDADGARVSKMKRAPRIDSIRSEKVGKSGENSRIKSSVSVSSANIPGADHYQHTKSSILRYETIKAKIDEDREEMIRQGKDPSMCFTNHGPGSLTGENRRTAPNSRAQSKLEKRSQSQYGLSDLDKKATQRRSSLPDIETTGDGSHHIRNPLGGNLDPSLMRQNLNGQVYNEQLYENGALSEAERRRQLARLGYTDVNSVAGYSSLPQDTRLLDGRQDNQRYEMHANGLAYPMLNDLASLNRDGSQSLVYSQGMPITYVPVANFAPVPTVATQGPMLMQQFQSLPTASLPGYQYVQSPLTTQVVTEQPISHQTVFPQQFSQSPVDPSSLGFQPVNPQPTTKPQNAQPSDSTLAQPVGLEGVPLQDLPVNKVPADKVSDPFPSVTLEENNDTIDASYVGRSVRRRPDIKESQAKELNETKEKVDKTFSSTTDIKIQEKTSRNDDSVLKIPQDKRKRNKMLEKKSVFTIAYDGMKTDQLRPDTGGKDP